MHRISEATLGFKPLEASDRELARYGLPPLPDPGRHPRLRAKWDRILARPLHIIAPELEPVRAFARNGPGTWPPRQLVIFGLAPAFGAGGAGVQSRI